MKKRKAANVLIIISVLLLLIGLWSEYSGIVFQKVYLIFYEMRADKNDVTNLDFFTYDDLPSILKFSIRPERGESPALDGADEGGPVYGIDIDGEIPAVDYYERKDYQDNHMRLIVPKLAVKAFVQNGTSSGHLSIGPGLYTISDLPGEGDFNVIIAAHREGRSAWFYNIDQLQEGDLLALQFNRNNFIYEYRETLIIANNDWSVTERTGESILTLTSCHPKGSNRQRIVVVAALIDILPMDAD